MFENILVWNALTKFYKNKAVLCSEICADILIDDSLWNCIDCANIGMKCYLLDAPWNQSYDPKIHKNIIKIYNWNEIFDKIK